MRPAAWAEVCPIPEKIRAKLLLPEALRTGRAFGDRVAKAVLEEERPLLMAQVSRSPQSTCRIWLEQSRDVGRVEPLIDHPLDVTRAERID
jgi:hypothetical protein